jgi:CPA2 family monovalent cation:H+ antiporter-2
VGGAVAGILALKTAATAAALRLLRQPPRVALAVGLGLAQVGEFSFVLERSGRAAGLVPFGLEGSGGQVLIAATVVLMVLTPQLLALGARLQRQSSRALPEGELDSHFAAPRLENHVVVAGYGQTARRLVPVLAGTRIPFCVITLSPAGAREAEARGFPVLRGDASRVRTLQLAGVEHAKSLVVPDDEASAAHRVISVARALNPTMHVAVRTRRHADAAELAHAGADEVVAEELEGVVQLFRDVLHHYSIDAEEIARHERTIRREGYSALLETHSDRLPAVECTLGEDCLDRRRVRLRDGAAAVGRELGTLELPAAHGLEALALHRRGEELVPRPDLRLVAGDVLELRGTARAFVSVAPLFRTAADPVPEASAAPVPRRVDTETAVTLDADPSRCPCTHLGTLRAVVPTSPGCEECLASGQSWVHLRLCMTCGHVGCCDSSKNKHATKHFHATKHPIARSIEPGEDWGWCYVDQMELDFS